MRIRHVPRERDEELLEWLRLRRKGWTWARIAKRYGGTWARIQQACAAVRKADEAESGESMAQHYG